MSGGAPDFFYREAQRLHYVARSAFKLLQIQKQHYIIKPGASVLDLGCAPGAWMQKVKVPQDHCDDRVHTLCADVLKMDTKLLMPYSHLGKGFSVILSDMCPPVSGIGSRDAALSGELGLKALQLSLGYPDDNDEHIKQEGILLRGGNLVIKLLEGEESQGFPKLCKERFKSTSWLRPKATRPASREIYFIAKCLK